MAIQALVIYAALGAVMWLGTTNHDLAFIHLDLCRITAESKAPQNSVNSMILVF